MWLLYTATCRCAHWQGNVGTGLPPDEWTTKTLVPFLCIFATFFEISLSSGVSNRGEKEVKPHWLGTGWACHLYYRGQIQSTLLTCQRYLKQNIFKNERYPLKEFLHFLKNFLLHTAERAWLESCPIVYPYHTLLSWETKRSLSVASRFSLKK